MSFSVHDDFASSKRQKPLISMRNDNKSIRTPNIRQNKAENDNGPKAASDSSF